MSGFTPGGSLWKVSFVVTLKPGENSAPIKPVPALQKLVSAFSKYSVASHLLIQGSRAEKAMKESQGVTSSLWRAHLLQQQCQFCIECASGCLCAQNPWD